MKTLRLDGKSALVTGSTRGIGAAIADGLAEAGATVVRHGSRPESGSGPLYVPADLSDPVLAPQLLDRAAEIAPDLSLLVCNAGSFFDREFLEMDAEPWERTMKLNVASPYFLIQAFARKLVASGRTGAVVIIGSTNGFQAEEDSTAYDISKGALAMMSKTLAVALAPHGIRVNCVGPGLIRTPLTSGWMDQQPEKIAHYNKKILCGRIGTPEDCAGACVFLLSEAAAYITGQTLLIDGGLTVGQIGKM